MTEAAETRQYWLEQAENALAYANARPASDIKGFCEAHKDRAEFLRLADLAAA